MMLDALIKSFGACPREVQGSWECLSFCPSQLQLQSGHQVHVVNMYESHRGLLPEYLAIKNNFMNVRETKKHKYIKLVLRFSVLTPRKTRWPRL